MLVDPARNVVVFRLSRGGGQTATAEAPTRAEDCVRQAWHTVRREHQARPDEVAELYSEWEPSAEDARFVAATFPSAKLTYSFQRPDEAGWDAAFDQARRIMEEARRRDVDRRMDHVQTEGELLPVLWSASSPRAALIESLPHRMVVPDRLYVAVAMVAPTPHGTIGMSHMTTSTQRELGGPPIAHLLDMAFDNLRSRLRMEGESSESGDLVTMHRTGSLAAAAVALPDFHPRLAGIVGDDRLIVGLPRQDHLLVAGASSGWVGHVEEAVLGSPHPADELVPSLLLFEPSGIRLLAERN